MNLLLKKSLFVNKIIFYIGNIIFLITKRTPNVSYMAMVNLYCLTNGKFLEKFNRKNISIPLKGKSVLFPKINSKKINKIVEEINNEGYNTFDYKLPFKAVNELKALSYKLKANVGTEQILFNPKNKKSNIYKFNPNEIIQNKWVQKLIMDPVLISIARTYLGTHPIFDFAAMWWSTDSKKNKEDSNKIDII